MPLRPGRSGEAGRRDSPGRVGEERRAIAWPTRAGEPAELPSRYPPSKAPFRLCECWGHRREAGEIRRGRWEEPPRRSGRGAEGNCPAHSGMGTLLSSQASNRPPNPLPGCVGPWGHRREAREISRGRREGPSQTRGEEKRVFAPSTQAQ